MEIFGCVKINASLDLTSWIMFSVLHTSVIYYKARCFEGTSATIVILKARFQFFFLGVKTEMQMICVSFGFPLLLQFCIKPKPMINCFVWILLIIYPLFHKTKALLLFFSIYQKNFHVLFSLNYVLIRYCFCSYWLNSSFHFHQPHHFSIQSYLNQHRVIVLY